MTITPGNASESGTNIPALNAVVVTPHDSTDLGTRSRFIYVGGTGHLSVEMNGSTVLFSAIPVGTILPIRVTRVNNTGTTATLIVSMF